MYMYTYLKNTIVINIIYNQCIDATQNMPIYYIHIRYFSLDKGFISPVEYKILFNTYGVLYIYYMCIDILFLNFIKFGVKLVVARSLYSDMIWA